MACQEKPETYWKRMTLYLLHWLSRSQCLCLLPTLCGQRLPKKRNKKGNQTKYLNSGYPYHSKFFLGEQSSRGMLCAGSELCHLAFSTPEGARHASHEQNNLAEAKGNSRFNQLSGKNELLFFFPNEQFGLSVNILQRDLLEESL